MALSEWWRIFGIGLRKESCNSANVSSQCANLAMRDQIVHKEILCWDLEREDAFGGREGVLMGCCGGGGVVELLTCMTGGSKA